MHNILIVDDEEYILEEMRELLSDEGFHTYSALNITEAENIFNSTKDINLVITDLKMPGGSGLELISNIESSTDQLVFFIIVSGHGSNEDLLSNIKSNCTFIQKPINLEELLNLVKQSLEKQLKEKNHDK